MKVQGKFYPLQHQEFLKLDRLLTQSELSAYLWLKTNDRFRRSKLVEADTQKIADRFIIESTKEKTKLLNLALIQVQLKVTQKEKRSLSKV